MNTLKLSLGSLALLVAALGGCAEDPATDAATANSDVVASEPASAKPVNITEEKITDPIGACVIDLSVLTIDTGDATASAKINEALRSRVPQDLKRLPCDSAATYGGAQKVKLNEHGLLSVEYRTEYSAVGGAHPYGQLQSWTFDVSTGALIGLAEAFDETARTAIAETCRTAVNSAELSYTCATDGKEDGLGGFAPVYSIEQGGVRLHPTELPEALWPVADEGSLTPWSALKGHITNATIAAYAR